MVVVREAISSRPYLSLILSRNVFRMRKSYLWGRKTATPNVVEDAEGIERNMFISEVKRIVNFAALADNQIDILYGELKAYCEMLRIDLFAMLEEENNNYK